VYDIHYVRCIELLATFVDHLSIHWLGDLGETHIGVKVISAKLVTADFGVKQMLVIN